jgi:hypothetical protein
MEGVKHDTGKLPWDLLPFDALQEVVNVLRVGSKKYTARNWESGISYSRCFGATLRHLLGSDEHAGWWNRAGLDKETQTSHLANAICELLFLLAFELRGKAEFDDRPNIKANSIDCGPVVIKHTDDSDSHIPL